MDSDNYARKVFHSTHPLSTTQDFFQIEFHIIFDDAVKQNPGLSMFFCFLSVYELDNITTQPNLNKGQEPLELSMVFNPDPSQLSL